jgi:hypothetical protein
MTYALHMHEQLRTALVASRKGSAHFHRARCDIAKL